MMEQHAPILLASLFTFLTTYYVFVLMDEE